MNIKLQSKNLEMTSAISEYIEKRVTNLEKLLNKIEERGGEVIVDFEVAKTTNHHKAGEVFQATYSVLLDGKKFFSSVTAEDLYQAIDEVKENIFHEINKNKDREKTLFHRGARSVKKMLKGLSKRNPFTAKY